MLGDHVAFTSMQNKSLSYFVLILGYSVSQTQSRYKGSSLSYYKRERHGTVLKLLVMVIISDFMNIHLATSSPRNTWGSIFLSGRGMRVYVCLCMWV